MAATKLSLYNGALALLGERKLASLSENREPRRALDDAWDDGAVNFCLAAGQWKFAKRTVQLTAEVAMAPEFGYRKAYQVPSDLMRTTSLCSDEYGNAPLLQYTQEAGFWFADVEPLYVGYVSNGASYGGDYSLWPAEFVSYVEAYLAYKVCTRITQDETKFDKLYKLQKKLLTDAASSDAMEGPTVFPPPGSWVASRGRGRRERGNRNSLIG